MNRITLTRIFLNLIILIFILAPISSYGEGTINLDGITLLPKAEIFTTPRSGNFIVGSTFETPIYINTKNNNINAINIKLSFDASKLAIVNPSGGKSIFGIWVEPPTYDNKKGTASLVGVIPGGVVTSSGLIATITFKAIAPGEARISITDYSSANMNDGLGSDVKISFSGSYYTISPKAPEGVTISSDTHPLQDHWYNNSSPILRWNSPDSITGYSTLLDVNPSTIPPTTITTNISQASFENIEDGVWYFHVRANVKGAWGNTSHFQIKVDTNKPAQFDPEINILKDEDGAKKYLISFLTTDPLSSIDRYEVGIIDQSAGKVASPVFIQSESPYLVPSTDSKSLRVIIRAFDTADNVQEAHVDLYPGINFVLIVKKYAPYLLGLLILFMLIELIIHYLFGHHVVDHMRKAYSIFKKISVKSEIKDEIIEQNIMSDQTPVDIVDKIPLPPYENEDNKITTSGIDIPQN